MLKALCAIPVAALTINAFATPIETDPVEDMVKTLEKQEVPAVNKTIQAITNVMEESPMSATTTTDNNTIDDNPLLVLDGKVVEWPADFISKKKINLDDEEVIAQLLHIKKEDIATITVFKGAPATAIYGEKAKNGIIAIETKAFQELPKDTCSSVEVEDEVFVVVEEKAQYPGGQEALMQFLAQNLHYPKIAMENDIQARIIVQFIIEKDGSCTDFKVVENDAHNSNGVMVTAMAQKARSDRQEGKETPSPEEIESWSKSLEDEAIRTLSLMPKWIPAKQRGRAVRLRNTIPITFRLQ